MRRNHRASGLAATAQIPDIDSDHDVSARTRGAAGIAGVSASAGAKAQRTSSNALKPAGAVVG